LVRPGIAVGMLAAFVALAWAAHGDSVLRGDVRLTRWAKGRSWPLLDELTDAASCSMRSVPLIVAGLFLVGVLAWRRMWPEAAIMTLALILMHLSYPLKEIVASPRPSADLVEETEGGGGYGFPGGRAGNAVLVIGACAWIAARHGESRWARTVIWGGAGLWIFVVGLARIMVGAHWPSDILGAWLWTIPVLIAIASAMDKWRTLSRSGEAPYSP
jgi:membrane-associated phospholipid phosphatase